MWFLKIFFVIVVLSLQMPPLYAADIFLGTSKKRFDKIPIGIVSFQVTTPAHTASSSPKQPVELNDVLTIESVLNADLIRSQLFRVIPLDQGDKNGLDLSKEPGKAVMDWAKNKGVLAIAWAKLYPIADKWVMESYAYEANEWKSIIRVRMTSDTVRPLAHRFSDKLIYHFTGEKGLAETKIAYASDRGGTREVYLMDYDGENKIRLTSAPYMILPPRWSFDATQVGYTFYNHGVSDVYLVNLATSQRRKVFSSSRLSFPPVWSPTGDRVAFASTKDGNSEVYTMHPDGTHLKRLTSHHAADLSPTWSSTGNEIAFTSDRGGTPQIYVMDADGGNTRRLTHSGDYNTSASWSPQGDWIAYTCRNGGGFLKLCAISVDGRQQVEITTQGAWDDESPSWAPNGREIVFTSNRFGKSQIYVIRPDGTGLTRLTSDEGKNTSPVWAPR